MLEDLKKKEITVCAIVIDSASAYAAARYEYPIDQLYSYRALPTNSTSAWILAINYEPPVVASRR
ncbi:hypothetical protein RhiirA1_464864 [Rhizophagus irregularis]|uniref:Uncharacterized protein n=1 Tax=Rhizophagus irregularis TaxID=588596 RepID=A0A2N0RH75_9GLOM|nr:hypothetical protein RhiirA1_464864 [Rhizophagus irregularis]